MVSTIYLGIPEYSIVDVVGVGVSEDDIAERIRLLTL